MDSSMNWKLTGCNVGCALGSCNEEIAATQSEALDLAVCLLWSLDEDHGLKNNVLEAEVVFWTTTFNFVIEGSLE